MTELKTPTTGNSKAVGASAYHGMGDNNHKFDVHPDERVELLTCVLDGRDYAIDIMMVREIRGWTEPTPMANAPAHMPGMINLRGVVLPIFDLAVRLKGGEAERIPRDVIIVVESGKRAAGLMVDGVTDIMTLPSDELRPAPNSAASAEENLIGSLIITNDKIIQLLDLDHVLGDLAED